MRKLLTCFFFVSCFFCPLVAETPATAAPTQENPLSSYDDWKSESQDKEKIEESSFPLIFTRMILLLLITIAAVVVFAWIAKRFLATRQLMQNRTSRLQIIERRPLTPKTALLLIEVDDEEFILAESHAGITFIKELKKSS